MKATKCFIFKIRGKQFRRPGSRLAFLRNKSTAIFNSGSRPTKMLGLLHRSYSRMKAGSK